jgi:hypothetical protein
MLKASILTIALGIGLLAGYPAAADVFPFCQGCAQAPGVDFTWYIPATGESEPPSEQPITVFFNFTQFETLTGEVFVPGRAVTIPSGSGFFNILDPDGSVSDVVNIAISPSAPRNFLSISVQSDPNFAHVGEPLGVLAMETDAGAVSDMVLPLVGGGAIGVILGFDGELPFPLPYGDGVADTSDYLRVIVGVPEPGSLGLLGFGLAGLISLRLLWRRANGF